MKKETLEEAAENYNDDFQIKGGSKAPHIKNQHIMNHFIAGAKWQAENNKKDIESLIKIIEWYDDNSDVRPSYHTETIGEITMWDWFEQFKNK